MPTHFETAAAFRAWFEKHAGDSTEIIVGFLKKKTGRPSLTWPEAVDEALCVGWIDGVRKRIDEHSYQIRFSPRKAGSTWSAVNIGRISVLTAQGRMKPAGLAAFARRVEAKSRRYAYEQNSVGDWGLVVEVQIRKDKLAWSFFAAQAPSYRKQVLWWIASAKQAQTKKARLEKLLEKSRNGQRL